MNLPKKTIRPGDEYDLVSQHVPVQRVRVISVDAQDVRYQIVCPALWTEPIFTEGICRADVFCFCYAPTDETKAAQAAGLALDVFREEEAQQKLAESDASEQAFAAQREYRMLFRMSEQERALLAD